MVKSNFKFRSVLFLMAVVLSPLAASILSTTPVSPAQAQLVSQQPISGPLPAGVTVNETVDTVANLTLTPNPVGVGQQFLVELMVTPEPQPDRVFQGLRVTATKPDGTVSTIGSLYSSPGKGSAWFTFVPDQVGHWLFKLDFAGMYYPAGQYYNGQIITNSFQGTFYTNSSYYRPASTQQWLVTEVEPVWPGTLQPCPSSGPGGIIVNFTGSGYPASTPVTISFQDHFYGQRLFTVNVTSDVSGRISFNTPIPDLKRSVGYPGDGEETSSAIDCTAQSRGIVYAYTTYEEYWRGLRSIGSLTASGLWGNGTNLALPSTNGESLQFLQVKPGDIIPITGEWFHPNDTIYIRWDNNVVAGTITDSEWRNTIILNATIANASGNFTAEITIPNADQGEHYLGVEDSQANVILKVLLSSGSLQLSSYSGPGGADVQVSGSGYPAFSSVNVSYLDPYVGAWKVWKSTTSDSSGRIAFTSEIPDFNGSLDSGDWSESYDLLVFRTEINNAIYTYSSFTEFWRGLKTIGNQTADGLFGNGTNLASNVNIQSGDTLILYGRWFHPGAIYVKWDGPAVVGTMTADQWHTATIVGTTNANTTGSFEITVTIPNATEGDHLIAIDDSQNRFIIIVHSHPPTPKISVFCKDGGTNLGSKVEIQGAISLNGTAIRGQPVFIQYSVTAGASWLDLTLVSSDTNGKFNALWIPSVTGIFLIRARVDATSIISAAEATTSFALIPASDQAVLSLSSNSTISAVAFNPTSRELSFNASGPSATTGQVSVNIPKTLLTDVNNLKVSLDGNPVAYTTDSQSDSWIISITYNHSTHKIIIDLGAIPSIPEMPNGEIIVVAMMAIAVSAGAVLKRQFKYHDASKRLR